MNPVYIFLADDDDIFLMREALQDIGMPFILDATWNGEDLIQNVSVFLPSLPDYIFIDINMPLKNGYETLEVLRNLLPDEIPIYIMSTACDSESVCFPFLEQ
jgi:CheY-like chemotaxis protein